jgi:hypothetical protein
MNMPGMQPTPRSAAGGGWCSGATAMNNGFTSGPLQDSTCLVYLFPTWVVDTPQKYAFAVLGTFLLCVFIEFLCFMRYSRLLKISDKWCRVGLYSSTYLLQVTLSYFVMMLAMTYSTYIFLAIVLGFTLGHVCFNADIFENRPVVLAVAVASNGEQKPVVAVAASAVPPVHKHACGGGHHEAVDLS